MRGFIALFISLFTISAFAHETYAGGFIDKEDYVSCPKKYIQFDQIGVADHGIYVSLGSHVIKTSAIHSDGFGLYFDDFKSIDDLWICPICRVLNPIARILCSSCPYTQ